MMRIETTRFGKIEVDAERVMTFPKGLLGFPGEQRFALLQAGEENYFFWLQSCHDPSLAFVVTDPTTFIRDYMLPIRHETAAELGLTDADVYSTAHEALQTFVICNRCGDWLTGNLLGPIVVNVTDRIGSQVVLTEKKWSTRQPLLRLGVSDAKPAGDIGHPSPDLAVNDAAAAEATPDHARPPAMPALRATTRRPARRVAANAANAVNAKSLDDATPMRVGPDADSGSELLPLAKSA